MIRWTDERVELLVSQLLRAGVVLAGLTVLTGLVLAEIRHRAPDVHHFHAPTGPWWPTWQDLAALDSRAIVQLGLLILIATPIARVALCVVAFVVQRDRLYIMLTLLVLGVLMYGMFFSP